MTSNTKIMNVRIGFIQRRSNAVSVTAYRAIRTGFANGQPVFQDERVQLVAFDATADKLTLVKGERTKFEVQECKRRSDGTSYLKIVGQAQAEAQPEAQPEAQAEAQPVQEDIETAQLDRLLELVAETEAPNASIIWVMATMNSPKARELALAHLRPLQGASFVAA